MDKQLQKEISELRNQLTHITNCVEELSKKIDQSDESSTIPKWVKMLADDSVPLSEVYKAQMEWDEDDYTIWNTSWNKTKEQRVKLLREALASWVLELQHRKFPSTTKSFSSVEEAQRMVENLTNYHNFQKQLIDIVKNNDQFDLELILRKDNHDNFKTYYAYINNIRQQMIECVNSFAEDSNIQLLWTGCSHTWNFFLHEAELAIFPDMQVIDPATFKPNPMPPKQQQAYKSRLLTVYKSDLTKAYEYLNRQPALME